MRTAFVRGLLGFFIALNIAGGTASAASSTAKPVCTKAKAGAAACMAKLKTDADGKVHAKASPAGYGPADLHRAYAIPAGGNATVAVVGAYGDPSIKSDLDRYNQTFGLPGFPACTTSAQRGCFSQVNQRGTAALPVTNAGWAVETALDVETIHQVCPGCRLVLVEADSTSLSDLTTAVDRAVAQGAAVVSMSWGGGEFATETGLDSHFTAPNTVFVASSGDSGYGVSYPAASNHVLAVGGTHLDLGGGQINETAWSGAGSGCSKFEAKPLWQHDKSCARRSLADLSADADPATGVAVYSSLSSQGAGWFVVGGTSLAAPLIAGMVAINGPHSQANVLSHIYSAVGSASLRDVIHGDNGSCKTYLCHAVAGYDGPTGLGTLVGVGAL